MKIKQKPEDFIVKELIDLDFSDNGKYVYFILKKKNYNTLDALIVLSKKLKIPLKRFGFAGNKDKKAITEQFVSVDCSVSKLENLKLKDIEIKIMGRGNKRIKLGDNKGNFFRIKFKVGKKYSFFANYFGEQRFGGSNVDKGRRIVKGDYWNVNEMNQDKNLRMYFHAYQSYLWNKVLGLYLRRYSGFEIDGYWFINEKIDNFSIPLISFDTEFKGEIGQIYKEILKEEGVESKDFLVRKFPKLISDTVFRDAFVFVRDFKSSVDYVEFSLPSGSYATVFLRKIS